MVALKTTLLIHPTASSTAAHSTIASATTALPKNPVPLTTGHIDTDLHVTDGHDLSHGVNSLALPAATSPLPHVGPMPAVIIGVGSQTIQGTNDTDFIFAETATGNIYANNGNDIVVLDTSYNFHDSPNGQAPYGRAHNVTEAHWGTKSVWGGAGSDILDFTDNLDAVELHGDSFNAADDWQSYNNDDRLYAGHNDDVLDGGLGSDLLLGNQGRDQLDGGRGGDMLYGGQGSDNFVFKFGGTGVASVLDADYIGDFIGVSDGGPPISDRILTDHMPGTADNFILGGKNDWSHAALTAETFIQSGKKYYFGSDGHDGYLFADLDGNHHVDSSIVLKDVGAYFDYHWIV